MRYLNTRLGRSKKGFTLIELLVVVIIIGILAAIAIPVFLSQREKAWDAAAQSDLRGIVTAEESYYTSADEYSTEVSTDGDADGTVDLQDEGFKGTDNVVTTVSVDSDGEAFCAAAAYDKSGTQVFYYNSEDGKIVGQAQGSTPPSTTSDHTCTEPTFS